MKLLTIGDSFAQGFISGGAARTDLSFSTLIARCLGLRPGVDYVFPEWPIGGHPVNIEPILRQLQRTFGPEVSGAFDWLRAKVLIAEALDRIEDYYEDGPGAAHRAYAGGVEYFHNIAVRGFDIADAWLVTPDLCRHSIASPQRFDSLFGDLSPVPDHSFFRTALTVLNPSRDVEFDQYSSLKWLEHHCAYEGVENLIIWLGTNNVLGVIASLEVRSTHTSHDRPLDMDFTGRRTFNFWSPQDFEREFEALLSRVDGAMHVNVAKDWRVFIANVPPVTIAPLACGRGRSRVCTDPFGVLDRATYFDCYDYVFSSRAADVRSNGLDRMTVEAIDRTIAEYNRSMVRLVEEANAAHLRKRYWLVDIAAALLRLAYRRNDGRPVVDLPANLRDRAHKPDTRYYRAGRQHLRAGGLVSLDGLHLSALGQGLIAEQFLGVMIEAGVPIGSDLDWPMIVASDRVWQRPLAIVDELFNYPELAQVLLRTCRMFREV